MKTRLFLWLILRAGLSVVFAQNTAVSVSGVVKSKATKLPMPYASIVLKTAKDSLFAAGAISGDDGRFTIAGIAPDNYVLEISFVGHRTQKQPLFAGSISEFLEVAHIELEENIQTLHEAVVADKQEAVDWKMDKKTYSAADNISQSGGSVLQAMQNLPGVSVEDGAVKRRGNAQVTALLDGKQTARTGFGSQTGLDNLPASSIEKIEIINNPSSKYDANGNGGIINLVMKKNKQEGFGGKAGMALGAGARRVKKENLPTIRPQYQCTPKVNPTLSRHYRKNKIKAFIQANNLYTHTLHKNEFVTRTYDDGTMVRQQTKRNRNTNFLTSKAGFDWSVDNQNIFSVSGMFGSEKIIDRGDEPFFNAELSERQRLWQFLEDELKTTAMSAATYQHKFKEPGHLLNIGFNYTYHRENEKYYFDNYLSDSYGRDSFKLISDEHVSDLTADYIKPLRFGKPEGGLKFRCRVIPTNMLFFPGANSSMGPNAGGWAVYTENTPTLYGNYLFENNKYEAEIGLRVEYADVRYEVNPDHNTYIKATPIATRNLSPMCGSLTNKRQS